MTERDWLKLFGEFSRLKTDERAKHQYDEWCRRAVSAGMARVFEVVKQRAQDLWHHTQTEIVVTAPNHSDTALGSAGPWMTSMTIELGDAQVYIYSSRFSGVMPQVRIATRRGRGRRMGRMITWHSCTLCSRPAGEIELYHFKPGSDGLGAEVSIDDFVYLAFDSLLRCAAPAKKLAMRDLLAGWPITPTPVIDMQAPPSPKVSAPGRQVTLKSFAFPQDRPTQRGLAAIAPPKRTTPVQFN